MTIYLPKDKLQNYNGWYLPTYCDHFHSTIGENNMQNNYQSRCDKEVFSRTPHKRTAIDIGGNVGLMARRYANVFDHVHSFEPVKENYSCLQFNTEDLENVTVYNQGLGEVKKEVEILLPLSVKSCGSWSILDFKNNEEEKRSETININTLDSYNFKDVDFMKLDIQGYELQVLEGAVETIREYKPTLLIETVSAGNNIAVQVGNFIKQFGYKEVKKINKDRVYTV